MGLIEWIKQHLWPASALLRPLGRSPFALNKGPTRLVLLRHAEKTGDKRDPHLSAAGTERAKRLVAYIPAMFGWPEFLIAALTSKKSRRPVETLEPLAKSLALPIYSDLDDEECDAVVKLLAEEPKYQGKRGVISWRHSDLPRLAAALGAPDLLLNGWPSDDYTSIIEIVYPGDGSVDAKRLLMPF